MVKLKSSKSARGVPNVHPLVHFEIASDNPDKLAEFYDALFGWKPQRAGEGYTQFTVTEGTGSIAAKSKVKPERAAAMRALIGGFVKRVAPGQKGVNYFLVSNLEKFTSKVKELGGGILVQKITVPKQGHVALVTDSEGNAFGLWQDDPKAKPAPGSNSPPNTSGSVNREYRREAA